MPTNIRLAKRKNSELIKLVSLKAFKLSKLILIMLKAQLTLETVIMLVVLLVLAGVMISLILTTLKPPTSPEKILSKQEFLVQCETYCNDPERVAEYCRLYWGGNDWNGNKVPYEIVQVGAYQWYACEDRIYCFLAKPCDRLGTGLELLKKCRDVLCGIYLDKYEDIELATEALKRDINFSKRCDFASVPSDENWYERIFESCETVGYPGETPTRTPTTTQPPPLPPSPPQG